MILIVEDEAGIVDNIVYALKTEGFQARWCPTGTEALEVVTREPVALIILDVGLPDINGFELFQEIKRIKNIPVIFLTARAQEIDRVVGLEIGADDYVVKPFSPRELTARVKAVLRRSTAAGKSQEAETSPAAPTPFRIIEKKNIILYFDKVLNLSLHEYRLLKALIAHPGWVLSREQLMQAAWEDPESSLTRTIDAHIKQLRRKLKAVRPEIDPILTHRGCGYSLKEDW